MRRKVLCLQPIHAKGMEILHSRDDLEIIVPESIEKAELMKHLPDADAIVVRIARIDREIIEAAPKLQIISRHGVGVDNIDIPAATENGVVVSTVGLANAPSVVEHTLAMMLSLAKRLDNLDDAVRTGDYMRKMKLEAIDIGGKTVLIIGLGRIGSRLITACNALGLKTLGVDPAFTAEEIREMGAEPVTDFRAALPQADFVTVHCPLQADTRNLIGARELAAMKPTAYLINCARGGIVDEAALVTALNAGKIRGAGLDVQVTEPPPSDDPLLKCKNLILTPHSAATTAEGMVRMSTTVAQNVLDYFDDKLPPAHIFNPDALKQKRKG